ncbi:MAG: ABC transporter substrate-binding protein [Desulfobacterales bacterium]|jgi:branched-chain amino acid transport system substrate-binding protein|nr:ABC transporter substrate-binding protein [Desulfobacterales bacterium]
MNKRIFIAFGIFMLTILFVVPNYAVAQLKPGDPIVIGVPTALGSIEGRDGWMAIQMARDEINAKGGVLVGNTKHKIEVYSIDTREHEPGIPVQDALTATEKLILEKKPHAIALGNFRSEVLLASMDLMSKYKLPYICSIAMTPLFQKKIADEYDKYKYCFRNALNAPYLVMYLQGVMGFVKKQFGFSKAYIIVQDTLWAQGTGKGLEKWYKENGWEVASFDAYALGASDFSPSLIKVRAQKAQVIVPIFDMPQSGILLKQARAMQIPALLAGFISPVAPENAWDVFEKEVEGMVNMQFEIGPLPVKAVPKSVAFNENFGKKWGKDARMNLSGHGPGPSYDSIYIFANAIERAKTVEPDALVSALEKTDLSGVIGRIRFGKDHQVIFGFDPKETALGCAFQWRKPGTRAVVFPEVVAESKIELPPYMK